MGWRGFDEKSLCCLDEMELSCSRCSYCGSIEFRTVRDQLLCSIRSVTVPILDSLTAKVKRHHTLNTHYFPQFLFSDLEKYREKDSKILEDMVF